MNENTVLYSEKYWSGNIRIVSDIFWCGVIAFFYGCAQKNFSGNSLPTSWAAAFFMFFFWSWKVEQVKKRFARWILHIICWTQFLGMLIMIGVCITYPKLIFPFHAWTLAIIIGIALSILIFIKYKRLMWPKIDNKLRRGLRAPD